MDREGWVAKAPGLTSPRRCGDLGDTRQELLTVGASHSASDPSKAEFVVARTIEQPALPFEMVEVRKKTGRDDSQLTPGLLTNLISSAARSEHQAPLTILAIMAKMST